MLVSIGGEAESVQGHAWHIAGENLSPVLPGPCANQSVAASSWIQNRGTDQLLGNQHGLIPGIPESSLVI